MESLGEKIRRARREKEITVKDLASAADISASQVSRIENDRQVPGFLTVAKIAKKLGVSLDELGGLIGGDPALSATFSGAGTMAARPSLKCVMDKLNTIEKALENRDKTRIQPVIRSEDKIKLKGYLKNNKGVEKVTSSGLICAPAHWAVDFALISGGDSLKNFHILDGDVLYCRQQKTCKHDDLVVLEGANYTSVKKAKNLNGELIFTDDSGKLSGMKAGERIAGIVIRVLKNFESLPALE